MKNYFVLIAEIVITTLLFSIISIIIKNISANPFTIAFARLAVTIFLFSFILIKRKKIDKLNRRQWIVLALMGLFFALHWVAFFYSIKISTPSTAVIGLTTYGVHLIILGWFFDKKSFTWTNIIAVLIAVIGNYIMVPEFSFNNNMTFGFSLGVLAGFLFALLPILHRKNDDIPIFSRTLGQFFFAFVFFLFFIPETNWNLNTNELLLLLFLGAGCTFIGHSLWVKITTQLSPAATSIIYYANVPTAMIFSYFLTGEEFTSPKIIGASLIILANIIGIYAQVKNKTFKDR